MWLQCRNSSDLLANPFRKPYVASERPNRPRVGNTHTFVNCNVMKGEQAAFGIETRGTWLWNGSN